MAIEVEFIIQHQAKGNQRLGGPERPCAFLPTSTIMQLTEDQKQLRERYLLALIEATYPLQNAAVDPEVTMELLIEAADMLKEHLQRELAELREEQD